MEEQLDASTLTLGSTIIIWETLNRKLHTFSKALFDDARMNSITEDLAKAENIIRKRFDLFLENRHCKLFFLLPSQPKPLGLSLGAFLSLKSIASINQFCHKIFHPVVMGVSP